MCWWCPNIGGIMWSAPVGNLLSASTRGYNWYKLLLLFLAVRVNYNVKKLDMLQSFVTNLASVPYICSHLIHTTK